MNNINFVEYMKKMMMTLTALLAGTMGLFAANEVKDVWLMPSTETVDHFPSYPLQDSYDITLAKGEVEHVQVVLTSFPKKNITFTDVTTPKDVKITQRLLTQVGGYMDALVPFQGTVKAVSSQSVVWLTFEAPRDCAASTQEYTVDVNSMRSKGTIHFNIHIVDVEIPLTPTIPSEFCVHMHQMPDNASDRQKELWNEFLLDRRIDPYWGTLVDMSIRRWDNSFSPWPWDDARTQKLLEDKRYNHFALPCLGGDDEFKRICKDMKQKGLFDRSYFYIWDEPKSQDVYNRIVSESKHLLSMEPDAKMLVTISSPLIDGPNSWNYEHTFKSLSEGVRIFPIAAEEYKNDENKAQVFRRQVEANGGEWWTYVCCAPQGEQPNLLLAQTPFHNRAVMWRVWKQGETGFLYWGVNHYNRNGKSLTFDPIGTWNAYGDGALVFPGDLFDIEEPVASVRLERWRDGQEDYELLHQVEQMIGRSATERLFEEVYRGPSDFTKSATEVEAFRLKLLNILDNFDTHKHMLIRGKSYEVDTLNAYMPGPGVMYKHLRIDTLPLEMHVLQIDLQQPHSKVKTFLAHNTVGKLERVSDACKRLSTEESDAFAGINGDFFNIKAHNELPIGAPRGGCVTDGMIIREPRSIDWAFAALDMDNRPIIDNMEFEGSAVSFKRPVKTHKFYDVNIPRGDNSTGDLTFFNEYAGGYTRMDENQNIGNKLKTEVFFKPDEGEDLRVNNAAKCIITRIIKDTKGNNKLEPGEYAFSGIDKGKEFLDGLVVGQKLKVNLTITTSGKEKPAIKEMVGGNTVLMKNGKLTSLNFSDGYNNVLYPRTAVGASADGRYLYWMVVDGRQEHSRGLCTDEMCDIFLSLGAADVVGFDGGGSAEMIVNHSVVNNPSDGNERAVADGWLMFTSAPKDNVISRLAFYHWNMKQIEAGRIPMHVMGYNQYNVLVNKNLADVTYTCTPGLGHIAQGELVLDGPERKGTVTATYKNVTVSRYFDLDNPTGIEQMVHDSFRLTIAKDPVENRVYLQLPGATNMPVALAVYGVDGTCVQHVQDNFSEVYTVDLTTLPAGAYIIKAVVGQESYSFKIILR